MDHSRKMLRFRDMLLFLNPPTQHEALLRARSAALAMNTKVAKNIFHDANDSSIDTHIIEVSKHSVRMGQQ